MSVSYREALNLILKNIKPPAVERVDVEDAVGKSLAEDVLSQEDYPPYDMALFDGFAINSCDKASLDTIKNFTPICTGDKMPENTDMVLLQEDVEVCREGLKVKKGLYGVETVLKKGMELKKGEKIYEAGRIVRPVDVSVLKNSGIEEIDVYRFPEVAVLPTGEEIVEKRIPETNSWMISLYLKSWGFPVIKFEVCGDDEESILEKIETANFDVLITTGGTSRGRRDAVRRIMEKKANIIFESSRLKPGKTAFFALYEDKPVFCLPGKPSACFSSFMCYTKPAIRKMAGGIISSFRAELSHELVGGEVSKFILCRFDGLRVEPVMGGSFFKNIGVSNSWFVLEENSAIREGEEIEVHLLD
jgi:molybdopterin molybdotransferase